MIREAIARAVAREDLGEAEAEQVMGAIMDGEATPAQISALAVALRMKGETVEEITGFARAMRSRALRLTPRVDALVDTAGTGGDRLNTFNISTTAALVAAGAGAHVAKHGNRAVSSRSGSADLLETLGVNLEAAPEVVARCIEEIGVGFLFAPRFHQAMRHAVGPRKEIGVRTVFNILGPLTNPAGAQHQVVGVYDRALVEPLARVLVALGTARAFVVHGLDGMDELSLSGETVVAEVHGGAVHVRTVAPEEAGLRRAPLDAIAGGTAAENARITTDVLQGAVGPQRDVVLLNAAAALVAAGLAEDLRDGARLAAQAIDRGDAYDRLLRLARATSA